MGNTFKRLLYLDRLYKNILSKLLEENERINIKNGAAVDYLAT